MSVAEEFAGLYGAAPDGVWAAPGRVNLIGEYTDFNDGFVLPLALPHTAVAAVSRRDDGVLRLHSADVPGGSGGPNRCPSGTAPLSGRPPSTSGPDDDPVGGTPEWVSLMLKKSPFTPATAP